MSSITPVFKQLTDQERAEQQRRWEEQKAATKARQPKVRRTSGIRTR